MRWTISNVACGSSSDDVIITVDDLPTVASAGIDQTICNLTASTLAGNTPVVGSGVWATAIGTGTADVPTSETSSISGLTIGASTTMTWTIPNGSCPASSDNMIITSDIQPVADAGIDQNVCNDTTSVLSGNIPTVGAGLWSLISGIASFVDS